MSLFHDFKAPQYGIPDIQTLEEVDVSHENERRYLVREMRKHPFAVPIAIVVMCTALGFVYTSY